MCRDGSCRPRVLASAAIFSIRRRERRTERAMTTPCKIQSYRMRPAKPARSRQWWSRGFIDCVRDRRLVLEHFGDVRDALDGTCIVQKDREGKLPATLRIDVPGEVLGFQLAIRERRASFGEHVAPGRQAPTAMRQGSVHAENREARSVELRDVALS